ncbi:hypothetical protein [Streptomyces shenzhenensis]|uniref:hypothetical protein n=1 Tax=Streptomyces shenzhenensis TaxID=943815 RepID=UPI0036AC89DC
MDEVAQGRSWFRRPYLFAGRPERILISSMAERVAALWPHTDFVRQPGLDAQSAV